MKSYRDDDDDGDDDVVDDDTAADIGGVGGRRFCPSPERAHAGMTLIDETSLGSIWGRGGGGKRG